MSELAYKVGIYCRLSRDDGNDALSMSIENQRESLTEYVNKNNWNLVEVYVDDGYTGTNFNRPGFLKMIDDIEAKRINCVITKDLSRLGRNYLQTGYYTEEYFTNHNVRYIAVNDSFDTKQDNDFAPFKNIINEWYAKDISKKVRYSMDQLMKRPRVIGSGRPLYGYMHTEDGKRIPDPDTAPVVRRIVNDYLLGKSSVTICKELQEDGIYCPAYYYYIKYNYMSSVYSKMTNINEKCNWSPKVIARMLRNVEYTGTLINHKTTNRSFKNKKIINIPEEERYIFEDIFEPLITKHEFMLLGQMLDSFKKEAIPENENKYQGLLTCGCCGKTLKYQRKTDKDRPTRYVYQCRNKSCNSRIYIKVSTIDEIIENELHILNKAILNNKEEFLEFASSFIDDKKSKEDDETTKLISRLKDESLALDNKMSALFEAHFNDEIPTSTYEKLMKKYKEEKQLVDKRLFDLGSKPKEKVDYLSDAEKIIKVLSEIKANDYNERINLLKILEGIIITKTIDGLHIKYNYVGSKIVKEFMLCKQSQQST